MHARATVVATVMALVACGIVRGQPAEPRMVDQVRSSFATIRVVDYPATGLRCLDFPPGRVVQSCIRREEPAALVLPYLRTMSAALALHPHPRSALLLGLGGGSLSSFLQHFFPAMRQVVVELDPAVVTVARRYFGFAPSPSTRVEIGDARAYLTRTTGRFDIVFLDAYGPDDVPLSLTTVEFFRTLRSCLAPGGVAVVNFWGPRANPLHERQIRTLAEVFPELLVLESGRPAGVGALFKSVAFPAGSDLNHIVIGRVGEGTAIAAWADRGRRLSRDRRLPFDLGTIVEAELVPAAVSPAAVPPLRDLDP